MFGSPTGRVFLLSLVSATCLAAMGCAATRVSFEETPQAPPPSANSPIINVGGGVAPSIPSSRAFQYFSQKDVDIRGFEFIEERKPDGSYRRIVKLQRGSGDPTEVNATTAGTIERMFLAGLQAGSAIAGRPAQLATPPPSTSAATTATPAPEAATTDDR